VASPSPIVGKIYDLIDIASLPQFLCVISDTLSLGNVLFGCVAVTAIELFELPSVRLRWQGEGHRCCSTGEVDLEAKLAEWEKFYNLARPHGGHNGKTP
jgi:hypothetical protein